MGLRSFIVSAAATLLLGSMAHADELQMPAGASASSGVPPRGMSMSMVESRFGTPARRVPAVGSPPITRWEYPGFVVYFEHQTVLHAVVQS